MGPRSDRHARLGSSPPPAKLRVVTEPARRYWFPARRYGWGWGPPSSWQGWVFLIAWIAVIFAVGRLAHNHPGLSVLFVAAMIAVMFAVYLAKGEPPRWRWGDRTKPRDD
jgi:hypothetical protein